MLRKTQSLEFQKFQSICARARPVGEVHSRTGMDSMFTSSKAYKAAPKLYKKDLDAGKNGIFCGPNAGTDKKDGKRGYLTEPFSGCVYDVIRDAVFEKGKEEVVDKSSQSFFDHGNEHENWALQAFMQIMGGNVVQPGRLHSPTIPWMAGTPDGIYYSASEDKTHVLEIKTLVGRVAERDDNNFEYFYGNFVNGAWMDTVDEEIYGGNPRNEHGQVYVLMKWDKIKVYRQSFIPPKYILQLLVEYNVTGLDTAYFIQFLPGGPFGGPEIHITYCELYVPLWEKMRPYWLEVWSLVEIMRSIKDEYDSLCNEENENIKNSKSINDEERRKKQQKIIELKKDLEELPFDKKYFARRYKQPIEIEFDE